MAKKLGFGFMRLPITDKEDQASIDFEQLNKMVDAFLERGFTVSVKKMTPIFKKFILIILQI
jgi:hypothetical protein